MTNINNQSQFLDKIAGLEDLDHENAAVCSGGKITLYDGASYTGASVSFTTSVPDLRSIGFNDRASSVQVSAGERWTLFKDVNYGGSAFTLGAGVYSLSIPNNSVSSVRRLA